jgi:hypothetical protein
VAAVFAGTTVLYNGALFFTYIAHFSGEMGVEAHSYFRYNTHLGLLLVLALVLLARDAAAERGWTPGGRRRALAAALFATVIVSPVVFFGDIRFDLDRGQQRAWQLAALARGQLDREPRLALLLPHDNGSVRSMLEGLIRFTPPRHVSAELRYVDRLTPGTLEALAASGFRAAVLSCAPSPGWAGVPAGSAGLLERKDAAWRVTAVWNYMGAPLERRGAKALEKAPLCLGPAS